jgi:hypothetical protein
MVTGLAIAMLAAAFITGGFGALADGQRPSGQVHSREMSAHAPAMPLRIAAGSQRPGQLTDQGSRCQLTDAVETVLDEGPFGGNGRVR